ncbi:putative spermidine/putrescine transport system substrate-binding protein [Murinocardiopsis flavida]|uniref:Putative spermidine/putrescine transport system substrate-binding protein n=1 Tax=Murinocardiopsis flavida TaxID=645275 RepID=A0A2P8DKG5_9ACTN|nr:ABC transporter substrate-binding protein [Murinocardiopsis flavida]PSK97715.1 putative spermidine/putrescine transport system substrate-binding protein [Murinocardiopsis flavida]
MRRAAAAAAGALAVTMALTSCAATRENDTDTLVVSTFAFATEDFMRVIGEPFEEATGIKVVLDTGTNATRLTKLRINKDRPDTDLVLISDFYAQIGKDMGLFEKVGPAEVPAVEDIAPWAVDPDGYGPAYTFQLLGLMYRTDMVERPPESWDALYGSAVPGGYALPDIAVSAGPMLVEATAETYGSGPADTDAGFERLAAAGPGAMQFYTQTTELTSLLERGEVAMAPGLDNFAMDAVESGRPIGFAVPDEGRVMTANTAQIVSGAPNRAGAAKFIDFMLDPQVQSEVAEVIYDKPVHPDAEVTELMTEVAGDSAVDPTGNGYHQGDLERLADERTAWLDRFVEEVAS